MGLMIVDEAAGCQAEELFDPELDHATYFADVVEVSCRTRQRLTLVGRGKRYRRNPEA
jgi:hypothetical protein